MNIDDDDNNNKFMCPLITTDDEQQRHITEIDILTSISKEQKMSGLIPIAW